MNVLVVEDNDASRLLLEATLARAGYRVETARDGAEALERIRAGGSGCSCRTGRCRG